MMYDYLVHWQCQNLNKLINFKMLGHSQLRLIPLYLCLLKWCLVFLDMVSHWALSQSVVTVGNTFVSLLPRRKRNTRKSSRIDEKPNTLVDCYVGNHFLLSFTGHLTRTFNLPPVHSTLLVHYVYTDFEAEYFVIIDKILIKWTVTMRNSSRLSIWFWKQYQHNVPVVQSVKNWCHL